MLIKKIAASLLQIRTDTVLKVDPTTYFSDVEKKKPVIYASLFPNSTHTHTLGLPNDYGHNVGQLRVPLL